MQSSALHSTILKATVLNPTRSVRDWVFEGACSARRHRSGWTGHSKLQPSVLGSLGCLVLRGLIQLLNPRVPDSAGFRVRDSDRRTFQLLPANHQSCETGSVRGISGYRRLNGKKMIRAVEAIAITQFPEVKLLALLDNQDFTDGEH